MTCPKLTWTSDTSDGSRRRAKAAVFGEHRHQEPDEPERRQPELDQGAVVGQERDGGKTNRERGCRAHVGSAHAEYHGSA